MPNIPTALYLDEDVSVVLAAILRAKWFDLLTARDADHLGQSDLAQLTFGATSNRVLLSHNRMDFESLHREWLSAGKAHAGIIIARRRLPSDLAARMSVSSQN
ncbi:MAG: DUF5615 family PIN-like protein [Nitrospirae bacterium]|nr:DUF5615 family PIN-like protein [Nitrospirota bacterium]